MDYYFEMNLMDLMDSLDSKKMRFIILSIIFFRLKNKTKDKTKDFPFFYSIY